MTWWFAPAATCSGSLWWRHSSPGSRAPWWSRRWRSTGRRQEEICWWSEDGTRWERAWQQKHTLIITSEMCETLNKRTGSWILNTEEGDSRATGSSSVWMWCVCRGEAASVLLKICESHHVSILVDFQVDGDAQDDATANLQERREGWHVSTRCATSITWGWIWRHLLEKTCSNSNSPASESKRQIVIFTE